MKKTTSLFLFLLFSSLIHLHAQPLLHNEGVLDSIIQYSQENSVMKDSVDWEEVTPKMKALHADSGLITATKYMLHELGDYHGRIWVDRIPYNGIIKRRKASSMVWEEEMKALYRTTEIPIHGELLDGEIGYVRVPGIGMGPLDSANAHEIYNTLTRISETANLKGWIVDLRLNGGGTMYPMLAGLHPFFGQGKVGAFVDPATDYEDPWIMDEGNMYVDTFQMTDYGIPLDLDLSEQAVVVLTSRLTASSGEITAIAFHGRPNTFFLGEETSGYTTTVSWVPLTERIIFQLTVSYYADRAGNVYAGTRIQPDEWMDGGDNFGNLMEDEKVIRAMEWLRKR